MEKIKNLLEENYSFKIKDIEKIKNVYRIIGVDDSEYCFKILEYNHGHFLFIIGAMKHLENNGFKGSVNIKKTKKGEDYIRVSGKNGYLVEWKKARIFNYDNIFDLEMATKTLATLHLKSRDFKVTKEMNPRYYWHRWIDTFNTRKEEILDFKKRIEEKGEKSEFDKLYLSEISREIKRGETTVRRLHENNYTKVMDKHIKNKSFCHHDYAHHNILIDKDKNIFVIDFDYCILDTHLHDLSSLLIRKMKNGNWDINTAKFILEIYNKNIEITKEDISIMASFIGFPQEFWQIGIQYYWERRKKGEEVFMDRLRKILSDRDEREEFVLRFMEEKI